MSAAEGRRSVGVLGAVVALVAGLLVTAAYLVGAVAGALPAVGPRWICTRRCAWPWERGPWEWVPNGC
jgi:hypothetical protein